MPSRCPFESLPPRRVLQVVDPQRLNMLNLGGFGMLAWDPQSPRPEIPFRYQSTQLPSYDENFRALSSKVQSTALLAHVRGIAYHVDAGFGPHNLHPFRGQNFRPKPA